MISGLRVAWRAIRDTYDEMFFLAGVNTLALLLCLPVVTLPPAIAGAAFVTHRTVHGRAFMPRDFWTGFRQYFGASWKLAGVSLVGWLLLIMNLRFYAIQTTPAIRLALIPWGCAGVLWLFSQFYLMPILISQEDKGVWAIFKTSFRLAVSRPFFNLVILVVVAFAAALMLLSGIIAALLLISFLTLTANAALMFRTEPEQWKAREEAEKAAKEEEKDRRSRAGRDTTGRRKRRR